MGKTGKAHGGRESIQVNACGDERGRAWFGDCSK